jgi:hypothetical protein
MHGRRKSETDWQSGVISSCILSGKAFLGKQLFMLFSASIAESVCHNIFMRRKKSWIFLKRLLFRALPKKIRASEAAG